MNKIIKKIKLADRIKLFEIEAPQISRKAKPGQFVILRLDEIGERIPLTIANSDIKNGTITIVFQECGATTTTLGTLKEGENILDLLGPLGTPAHIEMLGTVVCIGGGVGIAEIYPVAKAFKEAGNYVISILGARNKDFLIFKDEIKSIADECLIATDDGSSGTKGFVSDLLKDLINRKTIDLVSAVGPTIMMKVISDITRSHKIKTLVSLNPLMLDATGMCAICRVTIAGKIKFACVDGPEFDGHEVDFTELSSRLKMYIEEEKIALHEAEKRWCNNKECNI